MRCLSGRLSNSPSIYHGIRAGTPQIQCHGAFAPPAPSSRAIEARRRRPRRANHTVREPHRSTPRALGRSLRHADAFDSRSRPRTQFVERRYQDDKPNDNGNRKATHRCHDDGDGGSKCHGASSGLPGSRRRCDESRSWTRMSRIRLPVVRRFTRRSRPSVQSVLCANTVSTRYRRRGA